MIADATRALQAHEPAPRLGPAAPLDRAAAELASQRAAEAMRRAREDEERRWKHEQALLRERDLARDAHWREERAESEASDREKRGFETMIVRIGAFAVPFTVIGGLLGMNVALPPLGFWAVVGLAVTISPVLFLPPLTSGRKPAEPPAPPPVADARPRKRASPPG